MACIKSGEEYRWTSGIVPYLIDSTLADQERVTVLSLDCYSFCY
ncbi:hypothetical protein [Bacillus wiedmannii]|nr:hypothetical protein [Bacillus wiedmannii]